MFWLGSNIPYLSRVGLWCRAIFSNIIEWSVLYPGTLSARLISQIKSELIKKKSKSTLNFWLLQTYICVYPHLAFSKYQLSSSQFWLIAFKAFWWVLGRPPFLSSLTPITRLKSPAKIISSHAKSCKWSKTYFKKVGSSSFLQG